MISKMFGALRPHLCTVANPDARRYRQLYCGLCVALGRGFGQPFRLTLSHDVTLLAVVADGLQSETGPLDTCRCPMAPHSGRTVAGPASPSMRYAAAVHVLLIQQLIEDRVIDQGPWWSLLRPLVRPSGRRAEGVLADLGRDSEDLRSLQASQALVEASGELVHPEAAAGPTARLGASLLTRLPGLEGVHHALTGATTLDALHRIGSALGELIYLIDAFRDIGADLRSGAFNTCLERDAEGRRRVAADRVQRCSDRATHAITDLRAAAGSVAWRRNGQLIDHLLCHQLPRVATNHAAAAMHWAISAPYHPRRPTDVAAGEDAVPERESGKRRKRRWCPCDCCCCDADGDCCCHGCDAFDGCCCCDDCDCG